MFQIIKNHETGEEFEVVSGRGRGRRRYRADDGVEFSNIPRYRYALYEGEGERLSKLKALSEFENNE